MDKHQTTLTRLWLTTATGRLIAAACALLGLAAYGQGNHLYDLTPTSTAMGVNPGSGISGKLAGGGGGKQVGGTRSPEHAFLSSGNSFSAIDLHPAGYYMSMAFSTDGVQQCGYGNGGFGHHALVWSGSAASSADLNPSTYNYSYCLGVDGGLQVGFAEKVQYFVTISHAMLWSGNAGTAVDLHPATLYNYSRATAIRGGEQVGYISGTAFPLGEYFGYHNTSHAVRWAGSATSTVDLHPAGFDASEAWATNGLQQGGWGYIALGASPLHALMWSGTAGSVVDLHPAGFTESRVTAMTATQQIGEGWIGIPYAAGSVRHALLWSGTAESVVDLTLDQSSPLAYNYTHAVATGVDGSGNVVGYVYGIKGSLIPPAQGLAVPADAVPVIFAPGPTPFGSLRTFSLIGPDPLNSNSVAPGTSTTGLVNLVTPVPAVGDVTLTFLSSNPAVVPTPPAVSLPAGGNGILQFPISTSPTPLTLITWVNIYVTDGTNTQLRTLYVVPIVKLSTLSMNPVEGGFATSGTIALNIPAQGSAVVSLTSSNPALVTVPATVTVGSSLTAVSFLVTTSAVSALTLVPITATFNGQTVSATVSLSPAPVVGVSSISVPAVLGGQPFTGTVILNNFPRNAAGATVTLTSGDPNVVQVPSTVLVPQGALAANFSGTTSFVPGIKGISVKAVYNGSQVTGTISVNPTPTVTIVSAEYFTDTQLFKVQASTSWANSIMTFGTDPNSGPLGTMQFELGAWKGSMLMATAPTQATVWNSNGGQATVAVIIKTPATGGGGGGTATTFKLTTAKNGKGTVTVSPVAASYAARTVVSVTATPDPGSPWIGWTGACAGTATTCTVTMNSNLSVTANFK